ncbi:hypothetical protein ACP70R_026890 [Stipagrostis hirtigluma subsp. patula]
MRFSSNTAAAVGEASPTKGCSTETKDTVAPATAEKGAMEGCTTKKRKAEEVAADFLDGEKPADPVAADGGGGEGAPAGRGKTALPAEEVDWILSRKREYLTGDQGRAHFNSRRLSMEYFFTLLKFLNTHSANPGPAPAGDYCTPEGIEAHNILSDSFTEFQNWVREEYEKNGGVVYVDDEYLERRAESEQLVQDALDEIEEFDLSKIEGLVISNRRSDFYDDESDEEGEEVVEGPTTK